MTLTRMLNLVAQSGGDTTLFLSDEARDAERAAFLQDRPHDDLWVFGYGSLIWDPTVHFAEVRRAYAPTVQRRFIMRDIGGARGTMERPGLMAALDAGDGCHGLAFRIRANLVEDETYRLWMRERIAAAYYPQMIPVETAQGGITALSFLADYDSEFIFPDLTHEEQVRYCATGEGFLGSSYEYVANIAERFETLGIADPDLLRLLEDVRAYRDAMNN